MCENGLRSVRLLDYVTLAQKGLEFLHAEIGEDLVVPAHGGGLGLAGEAQHFVEGGAVNGNIGPAIGDAALREIIFSVVAPGANRV